MKLKNTDDEILTLDMRKKTLSVTITTPHWTCRNIMKLGDLKRALATKDYDMDMAWGVWVPVFTDYSDWPSPVVIRRIINKKRHFIGCQAFPPSEWAKLMTAVRMVRATPKGVDSWAGKLTR